MNNGDIQFIKDLKVGDYLQNGNKVLGIIITDSKESNLYRYINDDINIIVSGSQIIFENDKWTNLYNSEHAIRIKKYQKIYISYNY